MCPAVQVRPANVKRDRCGGIYGRNVHLIVIGPCNPQNAGVGARPDDHPGFFGNRRRGAQAGGLFVQDPEVGVPPQEIGTSEGDDRKTMCGGRDPKPFQEGSLSLGGALPVTRNLAMARVVRLCTSYMSFANRREASSNRPAAATASAVSLVALVTRNASARPNAT